MELVDHIPLLTVVAIATYLQTITGFAFGLIFMAGVVMFGIIPVSLGAILVSILSLLNCIIALCGKNTRWDRRIVMVSSLSGIITVPLGILGLNILDGQYFAWLQMVLGVSIIASSFILVRRPKLLKKCSPTSSFMIFGGLSGFMGGMFSTSGPPMVFQLYRQPLEQAVIRDCLLMVFAINSFQRLVIVGVQGELNIQVLGTSVVLIPVVLLFTWLGRHFPPPLSVRSLRHLAFFLMVGSGTGLCLSGLR